MAKVDNVTKRFLSAQDRLVFQASDLSLGALSQMVQKNAIDTAPGYQRRERWAADKRSALIESFLLNVPVPPIYLAEDEYGRYSVVDGKQRLTAIADFMSNELSLSNLESFEEIEGKRFKDLPEALRNALEVRPYLRVITLLKQSDPLLKYEVFIRLNRGGESMEPQELRNVAFRGALNDAIFELSANDHLRAALKIKGDDSPAYSRMLDAELVLRFLTLKSHWKSFKGGLREAMDQFMIDHKAASAKAISGMKADFTSAMGSCIEIWGDTAFRRPVGKSEWRDQLLNGMYDAQMIAVHSVPQKVVIKAIAKSDAVVSKTRKLFSDPDFDAATRQATNTPARIEYRINKIIETLKSA